MDSTSSQIQNESAKSPFQTVSSKGSTAAKEPQRWVSWTIPLALIVASIVHAIVIGVRMQPKKNMTDKQKQDLKIKRREALLRVFVGYLIGGVSAWLAIVNLFLPASFSSESMKNGAARRLIGFAWLAFAVGGIISASLRNVDEQRVAVATFTVFMLGATGVQLYTLKGRGKAIQVYHVPVLKLIVAVILVTFASITPSKQ